MGVKFTCVFLRIKWEYTLCPELHANSTVDSPSKKKSTVVLAENYLNRSAFFEGKTALLIQCI
jgi:hypothetical protein